MKRPSSVTIFGVLNIVFALQYALALCVTAVTYGAAVWGPLVLLSFHWRKDGSPEWLTTSLTIWFVLRAMAILAMGAGGIGLLLMKSWGRVASIAYAICAIVMLTVHMIASGVVLTPKVLMRLQLGVPAIANTALFVFQELLSGSLRLAYPILLLIFMRRANIVAAFSAQSDAPEAPGGAL
jgi:hypothetical protein